MTTTSQHIADLDVDRWAALTRRAAGDAVASAERRGKQPPAELAAVAAMNERQLVERRNRSGPPRKRLSPTMQLVEADRLRAVAEGRARDALQDKQDAEAAAAVARAHAEESARAAEAARERARAAEAGAARKDVDRAAERASAQQAVEQVRAELEQVRADTAAEVAAAQEQVRAADARAQQRADERAAERAAAQQTVAQVRAELEQVRADSAAEVAAAQEQARAGDARAQQRTDERAAERATAQQAIAQVRAELEQVRADSAAEVAAARGQARGEISAARHAAEAEVARAYAEADHARREAQATLARAPSTHVLTIPIPPLAVRAHTRLIENALTALHQIDYVLEVGVAEQGQSQIPVDVELLRTLVWTAREQAKDLPDELANLASLYTTQAEVEAAAGYADAAASAYRGFLQRIEAATQWLQSREEISDADIVEAVGSLLADLRAQNLL